MNEVDDEADSQAHWSKKYISVLGWYIYHITQAGETITGRDTVIERGIACFILKCEITDKLGGTSGYGEHDTHSKLDKTGLTLNSRPLWVQLRGSSRRIIENWQEFLLMNQLLLSQLERFHIMKTCFKWFPQMFVKLSHKQRSPSLHFLWCGRDGEKLFFFLFFFAVCCLLSFWVIIDPSGLWVLYLSLLWKNKGFNGSDMWPLMETKKKILFFLPPMAFVTNSDH